MKIDEKIANAAQKTLNDIVNAANKIKDPQTAKVIDQLATFMIGFIKYMATEKK